MVAGGNETVLGLIDWDGTRISKERVHVLSPLKRDGLESLLFDPMLLFSLVVRENIDFALQRQLVIGSESYAVLQKWNSVRWQSVVEAIERLIFSDETLIGKQEITYVNGLSLQISSRYLTLDDHALERKVIEKFPFLIPKSRRGGDLMRHMISTVLTDFPEFLPVDLLDTFRGLLAARLG